MFVNKLTAPSRGCANHQFTGGYDSDRSLVKVRQAEPKIKILSKDGIFCFVLFIINYSIFIIH